MRGWVPGWVRGWEMHNSEFACTVAAFDLNSQTVCPTVRWPCPSVYFRRRSGCVSKLGKRSTLLVVGRPSSAVRKTSTYRPRGGRFPDLKLAMSGNRPPIVRQPSTWWTTSGRFADGFRTLPVRCSNAIRAACKPIAFLIMYKYRYLYFIYQIRKVGDPLGGRSTLFRRPENVHLPPARWTYSGPQTDKVRKPSTWWTTSGRFPDALVRAAPKSSSSAPRHLLDASLCAMALMLVDVALIPRQSCK